VPAGWGAAARFNRLHYATRSQGNGISPESGVQSEKISLGLASSKYIFITWDVWSEALSSQRDWNTQVEKLSFQFDFF